MFKVEGRETCILLGCGAEGNFEMKPINFGTVKAKGNETNTAFAYGGGGGGTFWVFNFEQRETHIFLGCGK